MSDDESADGGDDFSAVSIVSSEVGSSDDDFQSQRAAKKPKLDKKPTSSVKVKPSPGQKSKSAPVPRSPAKKSVSKSQLASSPAKAVLPKTSTTVASASSSLPPTGRCNTMPPPSVQVSATSIDITHGAPVASESAAKKLIMQYMKQQNR